MPNSISELVLESMPNRLFEFVSNPVSESVFESVHEYSNSKLMHAQESNPNSKNEVTFSNSLLQIKTESHMDNEDLILFVAVRKGTREATKRLLYPLANFTSHKAF